MEELLRKIGKCDFTSDNQSEIRDIRQKGTLLWTIQYHGNTL